MSTLLVDKRGLKLNLDGACLKITGDEEATQSIPCSLLDRVIVQADTSISSSLLCRLGALGKPVLLLRGGRTEEWAVLTGRKGRDGRRRLLQYARATEEGWRERWAASLIRTKILRQARTLREAAEQRQRAPAEVRPAIEVLERAAEKLAGMGQGAKIPELMGVEGAASAAYFEGFTALFAPALEFTGRNRRPPRDPVNACLSLGYTIATMELAAAVMTRGYDPEIGFLHETSRGRPALALDLVETQRGAVDSMVWRLFHEQRLRPEHFSRKEGAVVMGKAGRRAFYEAIDTEAEEMARQRARLCAMLGKVLAGGDPRILEETTR